MINVNCGLIKQVSFIIHALKLACFKQTMLMINQFFGFKLQLSETRIFLTVISEKEQDEPMAQYNSFHQAELGYLFWPI